MGYYPESAEKDPRAPWNDDSPDYQCDNMVGPHDPCEWTSKRDDPIFLDEDGENWKCPRCGEEHYV